MKKSELKQVISEIVRRKMGGKTSSYGYVMKPMADDDPNDPRLQLIGYGNMPKSYWQKKLEKYAEELLQKVKDGDWNAAAYYMEKNSVFNLAVNMMKDVSSDDLKEQMDTDSEELQQDPRDVRKQKEMESLKKKQNNLNDKIRQIDATKQKLEDPIRRKIQDLERRKAPEVKKLGAVTKQIQDLQDT
jgi:predicted RNase H-like nuclease (RuvC/YqgF family)